jgi:hypothetical protein
MTIHHARSAEAASAALFIIDQSPVNEPFMPATAMRVASLAEAGPVKTLHVMRENPGIPTNRKDFRGIVGIGRPGLGPAAAPGINGIRSRNA